MKTSIYEIVIITIFISILFCSCQEAKSPEVEKRLNLLYSTINWHIETFSKAENLYPVGKGGAIPKQVESFKIVYQSEEKMTIPEVRRLLVKLNLALIEKVNANFENAPLLIQFPIGPAQSEVCISINDVNGKKYPLPFVSYASVINGNIYYTKIYKNPYRFEEMHQESFEEAQRIVNEEQGLK